MALHEKELVTISHMVIAITELQLYSSTGFLWFGSKAALLLGIPQNFVHAMYVYSLWDVARDLSFSSNLWLPGKPLSLSRFIYLWVSSTWLEKVLGELTNEPGKR